MRSIKMLGLAMVAAMVVTAFVGAGSASATISLCKAKETPCKTENKYILPLEVEGKLKTGTLAVLKAGIAEIKCSTSVIKGTAESELAGPPQQIKGLITSVTWENCTCLGSPTANAKPIQLSWVAHLQQKEPEEQGNGNFYVGQNAKGEQAGAEVFCTALGATCIYKVKETQPGATGEWGKLQFVGGAPATIIAKQLALKRVSGPCEVEGFWNAEYEVVKPNPVFLDS